MGLSRNPLVLRLTVYQSCILYLCHYDNFVSRTLMYTLATHRELHLFVLVQLPV